MGAAIDAAIDMVDVKIAKITIRQQDIVAYENTYGTDTATPQYPYTSIVTEKQRLTDEKSALQIYRDKLVQYKTNTDRLSGVATLSGSEAGGGCSLQDLLGSGCTPNDAVPDIDLKNLIDSLKQGDLLLALKDKMFNAAGFDDYQEALTAANNQINSFITSFNSLVNKAAIRNAVQAQITQIVFNLLSGCSGGIYDLTLKSNIKSTVSSYVSVLQDEADGKAFIDANGNVTSIATVTTDPSYLEQAAADAPSWTATVIIYDPEKQVKSFDLGSNYTDVNEAIDFLDGVLSKQGLVKYQFSIYKNGKRLGGISKN
jgi:hypothetical protein